MTKILMQYNRWGKVVTGGHVYEDNLFRWLKEDGVAIDRRSADAGMSRMLTATSIGCLILKPAQLNNTTRLWYVMLYIASGLQLISIQFSIFVRVILYWQIGMIFIFPALLSSLQKPANRYIVFSVALAASVLYFYMYVTTYSEVNGTIPYKSIL